MIKEIRYGGLSAQPNEYISEDGESALLMNLVPEKDGLQPMGMGKVIDGWSEGMTPLYIHSLSYYRHIIYEKSGALYWADTNNDDNSIIVNEGSNVMLNLDKYESVKNISAIGNTIIVTTNNKMHYALWQDGGYLYLGEKLPFVGIEFDVHLSSTHTLTVEDSFEDIPRGLQDDILNANTPGAGSNTTRDNRGDYTAALSSLTNAVYGQILKIVGENINPHGLFYQPLMVRYALRMYDESYVKHSAPVLLIPTTCAPRATISKAEAEDSALHITSTISVEAYSLQYRILLEDVAKWKDLIMGVDIFVSTPIYTWNQAENLKRNCVGYFPCLSRKIYTSNRTESNAPENIFAGHSDGIDKYTPYRGDRNYWQIPLNDKWEDDILSVHSFYKIASIPLDEITESNEFKKVPLDIENLSALATFPPLKDDFNSHCKVIGEFQYVYNNRLNLANIEYFPGDTLPIRTMGQFVKPQGDNFTPIKIDVWIKKEGKDIIASQTIGQSSSIENPYAIASTPISGELLPRFLFYPDANAYKIRIKGNGILKSFKLKPHDFLNGAYWWGGLDIGVSPEQTVIPNEDVVTTGVRIDNKLYTSEAENPWVFPSEGIRTIGNGEIKGIASATKALSEGQYGQFPLYAFTSEGVWSLSVTSNGLFNPAQPVTRDVCISADSITQLDQAVLFATNRGIMMLEGANTACITDKIESELAFDLSKLKGGDKLAEMSGIKGEAFNIVPFQEFIEGCSMVYDYTHQRIILYNKECSYAYVFSLESKAWGMMESNIVDKINSYPDAIVVTKDGELLNLSQENSAKMKGFMVSRALKLDGADVLKTIDTIVQRGDFNRGGVSTILWGSRDLKNWHLVWSSKDHYMRGFRGTPYKYYRIGALTNLGKDESLIGASINYEPKQTNKIR